MAARHSDETREVVTCRMVPSLLKALDDLAKGEDRSRSEMIEKAVREYVERHATKKSPPRQ